MKLGNPPVKICMIYMGGFFRRHKTFLCFSLHKEFVTTCELSGTKGVLQDTALTKITLMICCCCCPAPSGNTCCGPRGDVAPGPRTIWGLPSDEVLGPWWWGRNVWPLKSGPIGGPGDCWNSPWPLVSDEVCVPSGGCWKSSEEGPRAWRLGSGLNGESGGRWNPGRPDFPSGAVPIAGPPSFRICSCNTDGWPRKSGGGPPCRGPPEGPCLLPGADTIERAAASGPEGRNECCIFLPDSWRNGGRKMSAGPLLPEVVTLIVFNWLRCPFGNAACLFSLLWNGLLARKLPA